MAAWSRTSVLLILLAIVGTGTPLAAQTPDLRVERQGPYRRELRDATAVTTIFRVTRTGPGAGKLHGAVELPPGWRLIIPEAPFTLARGENDLRLLSIAIPPGAPAGSYRVRYQVRGAAAASDSVLLVVPIRRQLRLQVAEAPEFVAAGGEYAATFLLANLGNASEQVRLELASSADLVAGTGVERLSLAPGERRTIPVTVATPSRLATKLRHRLTLRVVEIADTAVRASAVSLVEIIPRADATTRPRARRSIPVRLAVRGAPDGTAAPFTLSGGGPLGSGGASIAFSAQTAGAPDALITAQDAYRLDLRSRGLDLSLGDQVQALSPLTGTGRFGFGGGGRLAVGPLVMRGFAQWDRRAAYRPGARGGALGLRLGGVGQVEATYLEPAPGSPPLRSVRAQLFPAAGQTIDLEYGLGTARPAEAYAVTLRGSRSHWSYELRRLRADSTFTAVSGLAAQDYAGLALRPWRRLRLEGSASMTDRTTLGSGGPFLFSFSREQRLYRGELGYGASSVEYRRSEQRRGPSPDSLFRTDEALRLRLDLRARRAWLQPFAELGRTSLTPGDARGSFRRLGLTTGVGDARGASASLSVESYHARRLGSTAPDDRLTAGFNTSLAVTGTTRLRLLSQGVRIDGPIRQWSGLLDATVEQELPFGHVLSARARLLAFGGSVRHTRSAVVFEYAVPLHLPLPHTSGATRLGGRVYDAETGAGVPDAIIRVGEQVVITDRAGRWAIAGLAPGTQRVVLDPRSLQPGQVPLATAPLEVRLAAGARSHLDLGVTKGARLVGRVRRYDFASNASLAAAARDTASRSVAERDILEQGGVAGLVVELTSAGQVLRRVTDTAGSFEFRDLPTGRWTATVLGGLPANHYLERDTVTVEVAPGRPGDLTLRVLPRIRRVRMLTEGELTLGSAPTRSPQPDGAAPSPASPRSSDDGATVRSRARIRHRYTVTRFDVSLMYVARFMYGDASLWPKIWVANRHQLSSPDVIRPGQVLLIPDPGPLTEEELAEARAYHAGYRSPPAEP